MKTIIAIAGHKTRGDEVIKILEMLGGENEEGLWGDNPNVAYYISHENTILCNWGCNSYTLEEFLAKFPYKVGDKVIYEDKRREITKMVWDGITNTVAYKLDDKLYCNVINELHPYKEEEIMEECVYAYNEINCYHQDFADKVQIRLGEDYEIEVEDGKTYIVRKKLQYPETYVECAKLLERFSAYNIEGYKNELLVKLQELLICRDAYWVIAGKELGLGKPWKPDWNNYDDTKYCIYTTENIISLDIFGIDNKILAFPTEKMRNAFYRHFKELIEVCKELL